MLSHKFRVGQLVGILAGAGTATSGQRNFKIPQLLRQEAGQCAYRVKTISESMTRIVRESEIDVSR